MKVKNKVKKVKNMGEVKNNANNPPNDTTEARIQQDIVRELWNRHCLVHHEPRSMVLSVPNEGNPLLVQIGARPGASDLIMHYRFKDEFTKVVKLRILFLEVKTPVGVQKPKQKEFQAHVEAMGLEYHLVRSVADAVAVLAQDSTTTIKYLKE